MERVIVVGWRCRHDQRTNQEKKLLYEKKVDTAKVVIKVQS